LEDCRLRTLDPPLWRQYERQRKNTHTRRQTDRQTERETEGERRTYAVTVRSGAVVVVLVLTARETDRCQLTSSVVSLHIDTLSYH